MQHPWHSLRKDLARRLTIMVIPHGTARPHQITFSLTFIGFMFVCWTGLTAWASYMASEQFDYWRVKANAHLTHIKMEYFANELRQAREMLDEVKDADNQLRSLIALGSRDAIIQSDANPLQRGKGGPTIAEQTEFQSLLEGRVTDMSLKDVSRQISMLRSEAKHRLDSFQDIKTQIDLQRRIFRATPMGWPVNGYITSRYGDRESPINGLEEYHTGMDIAVPPGTPVRATADGVVQLAGWAGGYGKVVQINHSFGYATRYGHNRQLLVKPGDHIKRGQIVALAGSTGNATGPHCHYEVWHHGRCVNPKRFMKKEG